MSRYLLKSFLIVACFSLVLPGCGGSGSNTVPEGEFDVEAEAQAQEDYAAELEDQQKQMEEQYGQRPGN